MNAMAPTRPTELQVCRVRLTASPAAAGEARGQVRAAIRAWDIPVEEDIAVLLTSELVTNAISHEAGTTIMLSVTPSFGQLRVDVRAAGAGGGDAAAHLRRAIGLAAPAAGLARVIRAARSQQGQAEHREQHRRAKGLSARRRAFLRSFFCASLE